MGVIAQFQISASNPTTVSGIGTGIKYFGSGPTASLLWNAGAKGVNSHVDSSTPLIGTTGQLSPAVNGKLFGGRFRIYASGVASSATTPTITPVVSINTNTISFPGYSTLLGGVPSAALTANLSVSWSIAGDLFMDPNNGTVSGFHKYTYQAAFPGTLSTQVAEAPINTAVIPPVIQSPGNPGLSVVGFVVGITFGTSDISNSASLYEFKIVQD